MPRVELRQALPVNDKFLTLLFLIRGAGHLLNAYAPMAQLPVLQSISVEQLLM